MSISGINSGQSLYNSSSTHKFTKIQTSLPIEKTNTSATVNISAKGKELYMDGQVDPNDPKVKADLAAIALPDWFVSMLPKERLLNLEGGLPEIKPRSEYSGEKNKAIDYCFNTALKFLNEESQKTEVTAAEKSYMKTSQPDLYDQYSEELHQSVKNRLLEDAKYMQYSALLGITV